MILLIKFKTTYLLYFEGTLNFRILSDLLYFGDRHKTVNKFEDFLLRGFLTCRIGLELRMKLRKNRRDKKQAKLCTRLGRLDRHIRLVGRALLMGFAGMIRRFLLKRLLRLNEFYLLCILLHKTDSGKGLLCLGRFLQRLFQVLT